MITTDIKYLFEEALRNSEPLRSSRYGNYLELQNIHFICDKDYVIDDLNDNAFDENWYKEFYDPIIADQLPACIDKLVEDQYTRQAILVMADRECYTKNDFICTSFMQVFINKDHIKYIVNMRSSDVAKFHNDLGWHKKILNKIKDELELRLGYQFTIDNIEWNAMSLHIYEKDLKNYFLV